MPGLSDSSESESSTDEDIKSDEEGEDNRKARTDVLTNLKAEDSLEKQFEGTPLTLLSLDNLRVDDEEGT